MKRFISLILVILMLAALLASCADNRDASLDSAVVGVVETSRWSTRINYYDSDFTLLKTKKVLLPMAGYITQPAVYTEGRAFTVSGIGELYANSKVIMSDTKADKIELLDVSASAILAMDAQGDAAFLISGLTSDLIRFDIQTEEEITLESEDSYGAFVYAHDDTVYFVSNNSEKCFLYLLDEKTLEIKKKYDVTEYFYSVEDMLIADGKLYIAALTKLDENGAEVFISDLVCLDLEKEEFTTVAIESQEPCKGLALYKDKLVVSSGDSKTAEIQSLTVLDLNTQETQTKVLDSLIDQIECKGNVLYCLSEDEKLILIDLTKSELPVLKEVNVLTNENYGVSAFFVI